MGEPAELTADEVAEAIEFAEEIYNSVNEDRETVYEGAKMIFYSGPDGKMVGMSFDMLFKLAAACIHLDRMVMIR